MQPNVHFAFPYPIHMLVSCSSRHRILHALLFAPRSIYIFA